MHCLGEFWMKNILIVSATSGNNYKLAQELENVVKTNIKKRNDKKIISTQVLTK